MKEQNETGKQLVEENEQLRRRVATLEAELAVSRKAEGELQVSESRYRTLAESSPDVVYVLDESATLLYANRTAAAYMGTSSASLVGKKQHDLFPPVQAQLHRERVRKVFETGEAGEQEETYRFGDQDVWLNVRSIPIRDAQGRVTSVMGVCRNITDRKRAEEALQKAHEELEQRVKQRTAELSTASERFRQLSERFSLATKAARVGIWDLDILRNQLDWDETIFRLWGIAPGAYESWQEGVHPEDLPRIEAETEMALRGEKEFDTEFRVVWADKSVHWIKAHAAVQRDADGKPVRMLGTNWDITERKQAEEALRRSEERFRVAQELSLDAFTILSSVRSDGGAIVDFRWEYLNPEAGRLLRHAPEALVGKRLLEILPGNKTNSDLFDRYVRVVETGQPHDYELFYSADTIRGWFRNMTVKLGDGIAIYFADITDRRQAEEAVEREWQSLWRMLQASDHERQVISYEIHDGLAQYLAAAEMQLEAHDALQKDSPEEAKKAYDAAAELVRQAHFEARRLISDVRPPVIDEVGIETAISHLIHEQRRRGGPKIKFHSVVHFDRLPPILENALYRILQEALVNACKHSKSKEVLVTLTQEDQTVCLEIRDWGVGFDPESVEKGHFGLEGIRQRARLLGGRLTVESAPGSGTSIKVALPILQQQIGGEPRR